MATKVSEILKKIHVKTFFISNIIYIRAIKIQTKNTVRNYILRLLVITFQPKFKKGSASRLC